MTALHAVTTPTPDGDFHMIVNDQDVVYASGFGDLAALKMRLPEALRDMPIITDAHHTYQQYVRAYYGGDAHALDRIARQQTGSEFQRAVWRAISTVQYGQTISYKELAALSGRPGAVRAAGTICGRNRLILLVPCHRILRSDGAVGSYLYGPTIKQSLLRRESRQG